MAAARPSPPAAFCYDRAIARRPPEALHVLGAEGRDQRRLRQRFRHVHAQLVGLAAQPQDALQTNLLGDLIQKVFSGSGKALVLAALDGHVSVREREEIRRLKRDRDVPAGKK